MPTPNLYTPYAELWPRVRKAAGRRVRLRELRNHDTALNTASRLRCDGLPKGISIEVEGRLIYGRAS